MAPIINPSQRPPLHPINQLFAETQEKAKIVLKQNEEIQKLHKKAQVELEKSLKSAEKTLRESENRNDAAAFLEDIVIAGIATYFIAETAKSARHYYSKNLSPNNAPIFPNSANHHFPEPDLEQYIKTGEPKSNSSNANDTEITTPNNPKNINDSILEENLAPTAPTENLNLPSFEVLKNGIKEALMNARKTAGLDGAADGKKVHLDEIMVQAKQSVFIPNKDLSDKEYRHVVDLAKKNIEDFIKTVAPQIDAHEATTNLFTRAYAQRSDLYVKDAASVALDDIQMQMKGFHGKINYLGEVVYSPFKNARPYTHLPYSQYERDRGNEEPNPYSPLGPSEFRQSDSYKCLDNNITNSQTTLNSSIPHNLSGYTHERSDHWNNALQHWENAVKHDLNILDGDLSFSVGTNGASVSFTTSTSKIANEAVAGLQERAEMVSEIVKGLAEGYCNSSPPRFASNPPIHFDGPIYPTFDYPQEQTK